MTPNSFLRSIDLRACAKTARMPSPHTPIKLQPPVAIATSQPIRLRPSHSNISNTSLDIHTPSRKGRKREGNPRKGKNRARREATPPPPPQVDSPSGALTPRTPWSRESVSLQEYGSPCSATISGSFIEVTTAAERHTSFELFVQAIFDDDCGFYQLSRSLFVANDWDEAKMKSSVSESSRFTHRCRLTRCAGNLVPYPVCDEGECVLHLPSLEEQGRLRSHSLPPRAWGCKVP
jgi:hypothetical protein